MKYLSRILLIGLSLFLVTSMTACTSSDDDSSIIEEEIESMGDASDDSDSIEDEVEELESELSDVSDDEEDEDSELASDDEEGDEEDEFTEDDDEEEIADVDDEEGDEDEFDDEEFDEDDDKEFADSDEEDDDEDFDDEAFDEDDEEALAQELKGEDGEGEYPEQEAQPQFPEEVIAQEEPQGEPQPPPPAEPVTIVSESVETPIDETAPDPILPQDDLGKADSIVPDEDEKPSNVTSWVPVVKVRTEPYFKNGRLMNTVYIARQGDNLQKVSEKIFGSDKSSMLLDDNSHLAKGMDPGDKVYYNSPNRSDDKDLLKIYYEDIDLAPQTYVTGKEDNMRKLGSKLLGFQEGWKEIWAINPTVDSKTILPQGLRLRYWTGQEMSPSLITANTEEPPLDPDGPPPVEALPEEPPLPEAAPLPEVAAQPEVLPEPIETLPEPDISQVPNEQPVAIGATKDQDSLLTIGAMALLVIAGAALVAIQIKNRKGSTGAPPSLEYTQV